jgi:hypothetical protein
MGGGSKAKAPPTPDYTALMKQQQAADQANYAQQLANQRTSQVTPMGSSSWSQDASGKWTQTETLSPELQQAYNNQLANQAKSQGLQSSALDQLQQLQAQGGFKDPGITAAYDPNYANQYATDYTKSLLARITPQQQVDMTNLDTKLKQQGLVPGTEAYDRAYQNLSKAQGDVNTQANLQGMMAGQQAGQSAFQTDLQGQSAKRDAALQDYMIPWSTASQAAGLAGGVNIPTMGTGVTSTPGLTTPDLMGAAQQQYAQQMQNYNQQQKQASGKGQGIGSTVGGLAGAAIGTWAMPGLGTAAGAKLGSSLGGSAGGAFSDLALKENVKPIDDEQAFNTLIDIVPITWNWKGLKTAGAGVAAQQIAERLPQLTGMTGGYLTVDYPSLFAMLQGAFRYLAKELNHE